MLLTNKDTHKHGGNNCRLKTWRIRLNLCFVEPTPSPQPKREIDRFSHFCTAHGRKSVHFTMGRPFPPKLPLPMADLDPHPTRDYLGPSERTIQTTSRSARRYFLHRWPQSVPILYNETPLPPSKMPLPRGSGPHSLDPPEFSTQTA